jgi:hypothetical protein
MRPLQQITEIEVLEHWKHVERHASLDFRPEIRKRLPSDLAWHLCRVEQEDIERLFLISSDDWARISGGTFRVSDVCARLDVPTRNRDAVRIGGDIRDKIEFLRSGGVLDQRLIAITDSRSLSGPFTVIEGNRRCVAFLRLGALVGAAVFVGCSLRVARCFWTRHTYHR